ncbi:transporter substrate-binding domain-containing protein [Vibrio chagasii]|nr:transporter substrate-binding domain-containing protein [Vibrio chagasii]
MLSSEQQTLVNDTSAVKSLIKNDWGPMDFSVAGKPNGYAIDLLNMIGEMTGIRFEFVNGFSWGELVSKFHKKEVLDGLMQSVQNYKKFKWHRWPIQ